MVPSISLIPQCAARDKVKTRTGAAVCVEKVKLDTQEPRRNGDVNRARDILERSGMTSC